MPIRQYLVTNRKFWSLSQGELAKLVGMSRQAISHYECQTMFPSFESALRLEIVFGMRPAHLFPALYEKAEEAVMREAVTLRDRLDGRVDDIALKKRGLLDLVMQRATQPSEA